MLPPARLPAPPRGVAAAGGASAVRPVDVRRANTTAVLRALVASSAPTGSADLVAGTELSRRTVELILADLVEDGWVVEVDAPEPRRGAGRPKKFYALVADHALVLSVVITPPRVRAVVADVRGVEVARAEGASPTPQRAADELGLAVAVAREALAATRRGAAGLSAVCVGVGGTVSSRGVVLTSPEREDWPGTDVAAPFVEAFGAPTWVENDTNLLALAEHTAGAVQDEETFVLLTPGNRISAGVVIEGELHRGFEGASGELVRLPALARAWQGHPVAMISAPEEHERAAARELIRRADRGEAEASRLVTEFLAATGDLIAVIGWLLAPPVLVLSGGFEGVEAPTARLLAAAMAGVELPHLDIRIAAPGEDGALRGGVHLALGAAGAGVFVPRD